MFASNWKPISSIIAAAAAAVCLLAATDAGAFKYDEHAKVSCAAVVLVCNDLGMETASTPEKTARIAAVKDLICSKACEQELASPKPSSQIADQLELSGPAALFPNCRLDFGDAVALIDYSNNADGLAARGCKKAESLKRSLATEAFEALLADEQFCPLNRQSYIQAHQTALGLARYAAESQAADALRRAFFHEARAIHLMEDAFSAGHLHTTLRDNLDPYVVTSVHNEYNNKWSELTNNLRPPEKWNAYGEGHILDPGNEVTYHHALRAVELSIRQVAMSYVREPSEAYVQIPDTVDYMPACPANQDPRDHHKGEARLELHDMSGLWGENDPLRRTMFSELSLSWVVPLSAHVALEVGPEVGIYHRRGLTAEQFRLGEQHHDVLRHAGIRAGLQLSTTPWKRLFRWSGSLVLHGGYLRTSVSSPAALRWFDGGDVQIGPEILAYWLAIKAGPVVGVRQSGTGDKWMGFWGPYVSVSVRW